jgi:hypothetical protein
MRHPVLSESHPKSDAIVSAGNLPEHVIPVWDHIWGEVVELHWFWTFHVDLCGNDEHVALIWEILPGPFMFIRKAVLSHFTMGVGRLLDHATEGNRGKRPNLSFAQLLQAIKPYSSPEFDVKMASMRDDAKAHCKPLLLWRDKRFGHADKDHVLGTERLPEVERQSIETVLSLLRDLLGEIHAHFNPGVTMHFPDRKGDADCLMKYIRGGYDAEQAEIACFFP